MSSVTIGFIGFGVLLGFIFLGVPITYAGAIVGVLGLLVIGGVDVTFHYMSSIPYSEVANYAYTVVPFYVLMGELASFGGFAAGAYKTGQKWIGNLPGGLAIATVVGGAGFGAVCGASVASSAVLGGICIPEMLKRGYSKPLSAGVVAASANLSSMIPPSALMIIYSIFTEQSLGKLFIAGVLPGLLIVVLFSITIFIQITKFQHYTHERIKISWGERVASLRHCWGIALIAVVVLGGIYTGIFSVTEAGAAGAFLAFLMTLFTGGLTRETMKIVLLKSVKTSVMVLFIIVGIMVFTHFLTLSRLPTVLSEFLIGLEVRPVVLIILILGFYMFLGMFFDAISMMALTLPLLFPTIVALGYDPIWFGIVCILMCEVGLITPPVGINCYVVNISNPDIKLTDVFRGAFPFVIANLVAAAILIAFPQIATFLPGLLAG